MQKVHRKYFGIFVGTNTLRKYSPRNVPCYKCDLAFGGGFVMPLYRYYQPVCGDNLPDPKGPLSATIPRQAIAEVNKQVQKATNSKKRQRRGAATVNIYLSRSTWECLGILQLFSYSLILTVSKYITTFPLQNRHGTSIYIHILEPCLLLKLWASAQCDLCTMALWHLNNDLCTRP